MNTCIRFNEKEARGHTSVFSDIDGSKDPQSLVNSLRQANSSPEIQAAKNSSLQILNIKEGDWVLDVGCGLGGELQALATIVGAAGQVVGVDQSRIMLDEIKKRICGLNLPIQLHQCDIHHLNFADSTFHACRAERVFMYLDNPRQALSEMIRVTKAGARINIIEPDWETLVLDTGDDPLSRKVVKLIRDGFPNTGIAHKLPVLFTQLGLVDVMVAAPTFVYRSFEQAEQVWRIQAAMERARDAGFISKRAATRWLEHLKSASTEGCFFAAMTGFGVLGTKP